MEASKTYKIYIVCVRIFFILLFGGLLYLMPFFIYDEGYQESYYITESKGYTFTHYLLMYPTEVCLPIALLLAVTGLVFKKKIGWIAAAAIVACMSGQIIYAEFPVGFLFSLLFFACL
ncbi:MAG: hypothetical protein WCF67_13455, partial [Chitinophagaceae bacterium]